jgi:hypothetical protein
MKTSIFLNRAVMLPLLLATPSLINFPLLNAPYIARADSASTSQLTGIKIPKGAASFDGARPNFSGVLLSLAKEGTVKQSPAGEAEVFAWRGDNYKPNRTEFTKTALSAALNGAGYTVKEIREDQLRDVNVFAHFDREDASLTFRPSVLKRAAYFQATNEAKGESVLGAWLEDDDALAVALLPVEFKAKPKAKPLPGVEGEGVVLVKDFTDSTKGLPAPKMPAFPRIAIKPGTVRGLAKDGGGKPIVGAQVVVHCSAGGGFRTSHKARTNAQGLYEVLLPTGIAEVVEAKANINYNGRKYEMSLHPVGGDFKQFEARKGHIQHLILRTSGEYGGNIRVLHGVPEGGTIEITVKPQGRQMDGSTGRTFVYRYPSGIGTGEKFLQFLPLGGYQITARLLEDGEALPLRVARTFGSEEETQPQSSLPVVFESGMDSLSGNTGKSGIRAFQVTLKP